MECTTCGEALKESQLVYRITRGVFDKEGDEIADMEEVGVYCEKCFPPLPEHV
jgi:hypothetical protein